MSRRARAALSPPLTGVLCRMSLAACLCLAGGGFASGGALLAPGDPALRQDIQLLADHGIVSGPVTSWPLAWEAILAELDGYEPSPDLPVHVTLALERLRARAYGVLERAAPRLSVGLSAAENPARLRSFADTPRENLEASAGLAWRRGGLSIELEGQAVRSPDDGRELRADGSVIGLDIGNFQVSANTLARWWGPGWDGSLVLSGNARPIPALTVDRRLTRPFESRWLGWIGPWDVSVIFGRMESDRAVPNARFFGLRANFRPLPSLEIGLSRTAQWCGDGRPCGLDTFVDLMLGRDNRGGDGIDEANEPGNQLAGFDLRWSTSVAGRPLALYGQLTGEDEAGGFPSRYLAQAGVETWGAWGETSSWRLFAEFAGTSCDFLKDDIFDCAYNHSIYETGYRYRGRVVGHAADNDAKILSLGGLLVGSGGEGWWVTVRHGELNRGGAPDAHNSLTATPQETTTLDVQHSRPFRYGTLEIGVGGERVEDAASNRTTNDARLFVRWRSGH